MKIKILYLGNKFYTYKKVNSVLETLEPLLAEFCDIKSASDKKHKFLRFIDMSYHFFRFGLRTEKIIIDVYSTNAFQFAYFFSVLSWMLNKKYILFLHGGNLPFRYENSHKRVTFIFSKAYKIIAPSLYLKSYFEEKGFIIEHIPNIIELDKYPFKLRENVRPNILAIRGFGKPYNPLMTLRAVNKLKVTIPNIQLLLLGNEDDFYYKDVIQFIKQNHLKEFVTIKPKCLRDEWVAFSKDYDIMISNPVIDNTPVSIIEGMALGMCVISTKVGGVPFMVSDSEVEFVNETDDYRKLAASIMKLYFDRGRCSELSKNGRLKAESFGWEIVKSSWKNLIYE
jgi:glycosyltransferase involved in cell wall biosynthesis